MSPLFCVPIVGTEHFLCSDSENRMVIDEQATTSDDLTQQTNRQNQSLSVDGKKP